jgi:hypothetical protein
MYVWGPHCAAGSAGNLCTSLSSAEGFREYSTESSCSTECDEFLGWPFERLVDSNERVLSTEKSGQVHLQLLIPGVHYVGPARVLNDIRKERNPACAGDQVPIIHSAATHRINWASPAIRARILCTCMHFKLQEALQVLEDLLNMASWLHMQNGAER